MLTTVCFTYKEKQCSLEVLVDEFYEVRVLFGSRRGVASLEQGPHVQVLE